MAAPIGGDKGNLEKLEKEKKSRWGGKRENSGRKPLIPKEELEIVRNMIAQHGAEQDDLQKKERLLVLLDKLYKLGTEGNVMAIKEYLDRQLGKAKERIEVSGDEEKPLKINVKRTIISKTK